MASLDVQSHVFPEAFPSVKVRVSGYEYDHQPKSLFHQQSHYEILVIKSGSGKHYVDFQEINLVPNQVFFLKPGQYHQFLPDPGTVFYFLALDHYDIQVNTVIRLDQFSFFHPLYWGGHLVFDEVDSIISLIQQLQKELRLSQDHQSGIVTSYVMILLLKVQQKFSLLEGSFEASCHTQSSLVTSFYDLLNEPHVIYRFVKQYADALFVSSNYLNEKVKQETGQAASFWINHKIALEAKRLLMDFKLSLKEISTRLQFKNLSHFSRFFKVHYRVSPSYYRKVFIQRLQK